MKLYKLDALKQTADLQLNVKEVRALMKAIFSVADQSEDLLVIGSQLYSISSMFHELEDLV